MNQNKLNFHLSKYIQNFNQYMYQLFSIFIFKVHLKLPVINIGFKKIHRLNQLFITSLFLDCIGIISIIFLSLKFRLIQTIITLKILLIIIKPLFSMQSFSMKIHIFCCINKSNTKVINKMHFDIIIDSFDII